MFEKLGLYALWVPFLQSPTHNMLQLAQPPQVPIVYQQESSQKQEEDKKIKAYEKKIQELEKGNDRLKEENNNLKAELKASEKSTISYGTLGATIAVSTLIMQGTLGFIEPQHTAHLKGIITDALVVAGCGYLWALVGYMHNPKSLQDTTAYRSKIIPSLCAAVGGLTTAIVLGNAFVTTKGYNQALFCSGLMIMMPLGISAGFHWCQQKDNKCLKS